jgi:hypothetical protein
MFVYLSSLQLHIRESEFDPENQSGFHPFDRFRQANSGTVPSNKQRPFSPNTHESANLNRKYFGGSD